MLVSTLELLNQARQEGYGVGAFNVYNLEEVQAVIETAENMHSPAILQMLPSALELGGTALIKLCLEAGRWASVPISVHLDHCSFEPHIRRALGAGISSVMADGSQYAYEKNIEFTRHAVQLARRTGAMVEAELGRLSGTEDGMTVTEYEARLTQPEQAADFVDRSGAKALAVCIGNIHGRYRRTPELDFDRLKAIGRKVNVPLVLHGTSGLPDEMVRRAISFGICKFNVNTELRQAYLTSAKAYLGDAGKAELTDLMRSVIDGVKAPVSAKLALFGSVGKGQS